MANLLEIKPYIYNFVEENLEPAFVNKIYWVGERVNVPSYPYCLLSVISENKDKRTSTHNGEYLDYEEAREVITTLYKTATITISIFNAYIENTYDEIDMDEAKEFAYEQISYLEEQFETRENQEKFYPLFSVQNISSIRPLHQVVDGGYMYRYEFDLVVGYNQTSSQNLDVGDSVIVDFDKKYADGNEDANNKIYFEVNSTTNMVYGKIISE